MDNTNILIDCRWIVANNGFASVIKMIFKAIDSQNVEELSNAITCLINNDKLLMEYGEAPKSRVEQLFNLNNIKKLYSEVCKIEKY